MLSHLLSSQVASAASASSSSSAGVASGNVEVQSMEVAADEPVYADGAWEDLREARAQALEHEDRSQHFRRQCWAEPGTLSVVVGRFLASGWT